MIELACVKEQIAGPALAIWDMLMDFGHPERLAPTIDSAEMTGDGEGAVRIIKSSRGLEIHEKLLECDRAGFRFRYAILDSGDMPFANVTSYECTIVLHPISPFITDIVWRSEGTVTGPVEPIRDFLGTLYGNANTLIGRQVSGGTDINEAANL